MALLGDGKRLQDFHCRTFEHKSKNAGFWSEERDPLKAAGRVLGWSLEKLRLEIILNAYRKTQFCNQKKQTFGSRSVNKDSGWTDQDETFQTSRCLPQPGLERETEGHIYFWLSIPNGNIVKGYFWFKKSGHHQKETSSELAKQKMQTK